MLNDSSKIVIHKLDFLNFDFLVSGNEQKRKRVSPFEEENQAEQVCTYEECSYPDISQFTGELTDFLLFLLPRFPLRSHLVIAHSKERRRLKESSQP